ncbi:MAG: adenosylcobinamide kinase / adenosylcobinamide-phosphate guanylyltransferase [Actinomycetota bacterium]|nr:adenosylcobinamide kinase / adenosylcobinamide-phosphate guanylyltransferase [Actinomycetota bacterium]
MLTPDGARRGDDAPLHVVAGDAVQHGRVRIIGLPGGPGGGPASGPGSGPGAPQAALVVASPESGTILWAPAGEPLPDLTLDALSGAGVDIAALALGPDGGALARTLAALRRAGALSDGCDVVAVQIGHGTASGPLSARLEAWGARLAPDDARLGPAREPGEIADARRRPRRTLVLGAASSGKSAVAEALLAAEPDVDYLPTGAAPSAADPEWAARVDAHRRRRPPWWRTLEGAGPAETLATPGSPVLLDSLGTWVSELLGRLGAWDDAPGWREAFEKEADAVVRAWTRTGRRVVAVGEETGWGVVPGTPAGRRFRDALGTVNQRLAAESEQVLLVVAGRIVPLADGPGLPAPEGAR